MKQAVVTAGAEIFCDGFTEADGAETIRIINSRRRHPLSNKSGASTVFRIRSAGGGYVVELVQGGRLVQTARALSLSEVPMVTAALAENHIPDSPRQADSSTGW